MTWAEQFNLPPGIRHGERWTPAEDAAVEAWADGRWHDRAMAKHLRRTVDAVKTRRNRHLGVTLFAERTVVDLARLFDVQEKTVTRFIELGALRARRRGSGMYSIVRRRKPVPWSIADDEIDAFIGEPRYWHLWRVGTGSLAEREWLTEARGVPWLTTPQVAAAVGITHAGIRFAIAQGRVPASRDLWGNHIVDPAAMPAILAMRWRGNGLTSQEQATATAMILAGQDTTAIMRALHRGSDLIAPFRRIVEAGQMAGEGDHRGNPWTDSEQYEQLGAGREGRPVSRWPVRRPDGLERRPRPVQAGSARSA